MGRNQRGMFAQYVTFVLVEGQYLASAINVLPAQRLNGMLFSFTTLPLNMRFYLRWTDGAA